MKSYDIVGYSFNAETLCGECVILALPTDTGQKFDGWGLSVRMKAEENLTEIAFAFGIDREDESTFDSDEFPKVVFADQLTADERCDHCGVKLENRV